MQTARRASSGWPATGRIARVPECQTGLHTARVSHQDLKSDARMSHILVFCLCVAIPHSLMAAAAPLIARSQRQGPQQQSASTPSQSDKDTSAKAENKPQLPAELRKLVPLNKQATVLLDKPGKRVVLRTRVCNREALLEMFLTLKGMKLHESILELDGKAIEVHSGLLAIGARPGSPARFYPEPIPSSGEEIEIFISYADKDGKRHRRRAQEWIRHSVNRYFMADLEKLPEGVTVPFEELRYDTRRKELLWFGPMSDEQKKRLDALSDDPQYREAVASFYRQGQKRPMKANFIFAGSFHFEDEDHERFYTAEGGYVICVANLPEALIDVNVASSDSNGSLSYETWTERIPAVDTPVTVELIPTGRFFKRPAGTSTPATDAPAGADRDAQPPAKNDGA